MTAYEIIFKMVSHCPFKTVNAQLSKIDAAFLLLNISHTSRDSFPNVGVSVKFERTEILIMIRILEIFDDYIKRQKT